MAKILIADDNRTILNVVRRMLEGFGHEVVTAGNGEEALALVDDEVDVILLDIEMPVLDGFGTLEQLNNRDLLVPVLFLTGSGSTENAVRALHLGAYDFIRKPVEDIELFRFHIQRAVERRISLLEEQHYRNVLEDDIYAKAAQLEKQNRLLKTYFHSLENATMQILSSFQNAMEEKDFYTAGHTHRVTGYALMLGRAMKLMESEMLVLKRAAQFHDIGKLVIDLSCIQKPGKLTEEEWKIIRKHPEVGSNIVKPPGFMEREQVIIRHHHERVDGGGYPDRMTGDELDVLTKIVTVVDSYDAMTSQRNYKVNKSMEEAVEELHLCSGSQFDREVVTCFTRNIVRYSPQKFDVTSEKRDNFGI
ncbi:MAG: cyclic di-GMP phosphodiesterase response regulator [Deltaproteobacteria bacterium]|nr:MAG: cyclic di-GMP phosphodiesterase response regulator [Deltaproteobacteria bacterium]